MKTFKRPPPTVFEPEWLAECEIVRYLANSGTGRNKNVCFDLFCNVTRIKQVGGFIHAIGINYRTNIPTVLVLKKV